MPNLISPIANPLADEKLESTAYKLLEKLHPLKQLARGVKEVKKQLKRDKKGILLLAADCMPTQILAAFPTMAAEKNVPYMFLRSKSDIAKACGLKDSVVAVLAYESEDKDYKKVFEAAQKKMIDNVGFKVV
ncbi:Ribosomal protein L7Ae/L30e/S12e/Gadd45 family protein [Spironucleus salmonicida]|uniref:H/ACA ribonucleoprotein complex subunit 2 n=1 Tax=Spironucleus salmonicida TaxID=348837 RepID=V6LWJ4_9EUKA|nr:Ribosomal protein L7Ae/L30e/S12e/Gadd45 family protein [Spironucleus salmonicida]|eukprot:EST49012.1 H/ACA ribonucleoprotein complex subunit 2-like protein [Spironucleus salmonicida]